MIVKKCMTEKVELGNPNMSLYDAAKKMRDGDFGILPIEENDKLVGVITDRDIAVRGVAEGLDPKKVKVSEIMTDRVLYCYEDQSLDADYQSSIVKKDL
jgi:CBS domain-containing protein